MRANLEKKHDESLKGLEESARRLKDTVILQEIQQLIARSRSLLESGRVGEAAEVYDQARKRIKTAKTSKEANHLAGKLLLLETLYLALLLFLGYAFYRWPEFGVWKGLRGEQFVTYLQTVWFGALGGITIAIFGIYQHVTARDFDPEFKFWYMCKPLIGGIFGWFIALVFSLGLATFRDDEIQLADSKLPFLIAFLAGFSERFSVKMVNKIMEVLLSWKEESAPGAAETKR